MKNKKPNAELVWKQLEDLLAPRLRLLVIDRAVYSHLLRHSRLEGKLRLRFSILWLGRNIRLSQTAMLLMSGGRRAVKRQPEKADNDHTPDDVRYSPTVNAAGGSSLTG